MDWTQARCHRISNSTKALATCKTYLISLLVHELSEMLTNMMKYVESKASHLVVRLDNSLRFFCGHDHLVVSEFLHGFFNPGQEVPRPHNVARNRRSVTRNWGIVLVLLISFLNRINIQPIVLKNHQVFCIEISLQALPLKDRLELAKEIKGMVG